MIESEDAPDDAQESSSMSDFATISSFPIHSASNLSCHSNHLVSLLKMTKPLDPLKGDAHEENTSCSHKLSGWKISRIPLTRQTSRALVKTGANVDKMDNEMT
jgi:hypothetical protein